MAFEAFFDSLGQALGVLSVGLWKQHGEFIATDPKSVIVTADGFRHRAGEAAQELIAPSVAVGVVRPFEVAHIEKQ